MTDIFGSTYANMLGNINGIADRITSRRAGQQMTSGNTRGAANALFAGGDIQGGRRLQADMAEQEAAAKQAEAAAMAEQVAFTRQTVRALRDSEDPLSAFDQLAPAFRQMGTDDAQIGQLRQGLQTGGRAFLDQIEAIATEQERKLQIQNLGNGYAVAIDEGTGQVVNEYRAPQPMQNVGGVLIDPDTREVVLDTREPKYQTIQNSDGSTSLVAIDQPAPIRGGGSGATEPSAILDRIIQREGGFVASDGRSGAPANFGINQRANPDIDVRNLTEGRARQIYQERYINPIVQAGVTGPALEAVVDFGVNAGVGRSLDFWRRSGGDINEFNRLRLAHYRSLPDYAQNGRSWERRVAETTPGQRGAEVPVQGGVRTVATGANNGPTPAQQVAQSREDRQARRDLTAMRREYDNLPEVKSFKTVEQSYRTLRSLASSGSATDDVAMIFNFMRMLDPNSVVREGEYAIVGRAQGIGGRALLALERLDSGASLTPELRRELVSTASREFQARQQTINQLRDQYRTYAAEDGGDPDRVAPIRPTESGATAPRLRFQPTEAQTRISQQIVRSRPSEGARGAQTNPILINPADPTTSYGNVRSGQYFITPDGQVRRKP